MWQRLKGALCCAVLAAAAGVAVQAILLLHAATVATRALPGVVSDELRLTRVGLLNQVAATRREVLTRTERQVSALRRDVMGQVTEIRITADRRVGESLERVDAALGKVEEIRGDVKPVLENAALIEQHADKTITDLHPQLLGLVAATKVTMGQTAETMRDLQRATPGFIASWQQIADHVNVMTDSAAKASASTEHTMENFAAASKPLPTWARIALGIGPPVAQMGAAGVAAGSALGWIK